MNYEIKCPHCNGPMSNRTAIDRVPELDPQVTLDEMLHEQAKPGNKPAILLVLECQRCGFRKYKVLLGLPDDEQTYEEWARREAQILMDAPNAFERRT